MLAIEAFVVVVRSLPLTIYRLMQHGVHDMVVIWQQTFYPSDCRSRQMTHKVQVRMRFENNVMYSVKAAMATEA
jgi:hypothetical protein